MGSICMQILIVGAFKKIRSEMLVFYRARVAPATTDCSGTFAGAIIVPNSLPARAKGLGSRIEDYYFTTTLVRFSKFKVLH